MDRILIVELSYNAKGEAMNALDNLTDEFGEKITRTDYDNGKDVDVKINAPDPREIAARFFSLFLNHPQIHDIRFKRV